MEYVRGGPVRLVDPKGTLSLAISSTSIAVVRFIDSKLDEIKEGALGINEMGPLDAYDAAYGHTADFANREAQRLATKYECDKADRADIENAVRHAIWQAKLTILNGESEAMSAAALHEAKSNANPTADSNADLINNIMGREIGKRLAGGNYANDEAVSQIVEQALIKGRLLGRGVGTTMAFHMPKRSKTCGPCGTMQTLDPSDELSTESSANSSENSGKSGRP